ncbi:MAG: ABC transporter ATP-binding protein, partial [Candidatus Fermentibacteria bacterium]
QPPPHEKLEFLSGISSIESDHGIFKFYTETPGKVATSLAVLTSDLGLELEQLNTREPSLEDVFLYHTGDGDSQ